jgi:hypothetical protein
MTITNYTDKELKQAQRIAELEAACTVAKNALEKWIETTSSCDLGALDAQILSAITQLNAAITGGQQ